jgi:hypothetical protein
MRMGWSSAWARCQGPARATDSSRSCARSSPRRAEGPASGGAVGPRRAPAPTSCRAGPSGGCRPAGRRRRRVQPRVESRHEVLCTMAPRHNRRCPAAQEQTVVASLTCRKPCRQIRGDTKPQLPKGRDQQLLVGQHVDRHVRRMGECAEERAHPRGRVPPGLRAYARHLYGEPGVVERRRAPPDCRVNETRQPWRLSCSPPVGPATQSPG